MPLLKVYPDSLVKNGLPDVDACSDVDDICNKIREAGKGFGTDEEYVIRSLVRALVCLLTNLRFDSSLFTANSSKLLVA